MGQDISNGVKAHLEIPNSLRAVHPFLYEAQRGLIYLQSPQDANVLTRRKRVIIACINRAFKLLNIFNLDLDAPGQQYISYSTTIRDSLLADVMQGQTGIDVSSLCVLVNAHNRFAQPARPHELLFVEANETLSLAEEQFREGFYPAASLNYHAAAVYYRVMEAMLPGAYEAVHHQLQFCVSRLRMTSSMSLNFIREHFTDGASCVELYEVHGSSRLGKGSYGSVYLATHRVTGDERAVKVMNVERVTSYYLRKLHTEIEVLKSLDHPNIVKIQDVFFGKRSVYVVTDLCRGGELFELLNSGKSQGFVFREDRAAMLMRDMISAVHYLHTKCIMHRDLKLENFLFATKSPTSSLILIDFGLSKRFEPGEMLNQRLRLSFGSNLLSNIAPEVLASSYDYRCDVWSLGVLCFMLLSGSPPFYGNTADDVYDGIMNHEVHYPEKKFRQVSPVCMDFLRRLLIKDPKLRMSTAVALAHPYITGNMSSTPSSDPTSTSLPAVSSSPLAGVAASIMGSLPFNLFGSAVSTFDGSRSLPDVAHAPSALDRSGLGATSTATSDSASNQKSPSVFTFSSEALQVHQQQRQRAELALHVPAPQNLSYTPGSLAAQAASVVVSGTVGLSNFGRFSAHEADVIINSICHFVQSDPLIKLTLLMISHSIPPEETVFLRQEFQRIDADHNGTVSLQEFTLALSQATKITSREIDPTVTYLAMCIERSHGHGSELNYHEYLAAAMCGRVEVDLSRVHLAFDTLDTDEVGIISAESVRKALGNDIPEHILDAMIKPLEVAAGGDGITVERFLAHWGQKTDAWMPVTPPRLELTRSPGQAKSSSATVPGPHQDRDSSTSAITVTPWAGELNSRSRTVTFATTATGATGETMQQSEFDSSRSSTLGADCDDSQDQNSDKRMKRSAASESQMEIDS